MQILISFNINIIKQTENETEDIINKTLEEDITIDDELMVKYNEQCGEYNQNIIKEMSIFMILYNQRVLNTQTLNKNNKNYTQPQITNDTQTQTINDTQLQNKNYTQIQNTNHTQLQNTQQLNDINTNTQPHMLTSIDKINTQPHMSKDIYKTNTQPTILTSINKNNTQILNNNNDTQKQLKDTQI